MYLVNKLYKHTVLRYALTKHKVAPGLYLLKNGSGRYAEICIDVSNPLYSHLGDQLFYQPLLHRLLECGVKVKIAPSGAMKEYFRLLYGPTVVSDCVELKARSLTIMPFWAYRPNLDSGNSDLLLVDFTDSDIGIHVSGWLVAKVSDMLGLDVDDNFDPALHVHAKLMDRGVNECLPRSGDVAIFNNYVDSGKFRININHQKTLSACAKNFKQDGFTILHVGSNADLLNDARSYDFVDIDVRGKISPLDLMLYLYRPNVKCSVTFDNFVMHASLMANKMSHVRFRGRYTRSAREYHYKYVNEAFKTVAGKNLIRYI